MTTKRTKEEKLKLISSYEASGLSKGAWCKANGILISTFTDWICSTKSDIRNPKSKKRIVEGTFPAGLQGQPEPQTKNTTKIIVEYKSFKMWR